jgi:hypothetical protein
MFDSDSIGAFYLFERFLFIFGMQCLTFLHVHNSEVSAGNIPMQKRDECFDNGHWGRYIVHCSEKT